MLFCLSSRPWLSLGFVFAGDDWLILNNVKHIMFARPGMLNTPTLLLLKGIVNVGSLKLLQLHIL